MRPGVDVALVDLGVDDDAGRAPLPRHRVFAARIESGRRPIPASMFLKFSIWSGIGLQQQAFVDPDRHEGLPTAPTMSKPCAARRLTLASAVSLES